MLSLCGEPRLTRVLAGARRTRYYGDSLHSLHSVTPLSYQTFAGRPQLFHDPVSAAKWPEFEYPFRPVPKITIAGLTFAANEHINLVPELRHEDFNEYSEGALAAPVALLRNFADRRLPLDYPLIAFTGPGLGHLTDADRDLFWNCFEVPVFEYLLGVENQLIARECEAHGCLHVSPNFHVEAIAGQIVATPLHPNSMIVLRLKTELNAQLEERRCECGVNALRLARVRPALRTFAAGA